MLLFHSFIRFITASKTKKNAPIPWFYWFPGENSRHLMNKIYNNKLFYLNFSSNAVYNYKEEKNDVLDSGKKKIHHLKEKNLEGLNNNRRSGNYKVNIVSHLMDNGNKKLKSGNNKLEIGDNNLESGNNKLESKTSKLESGNNKLESGNKKMESETNKWESGNNKEEVGSDNLEDRNYAEENLNIYETNDYYR